LTNSFSKVFAYQYAPNLVRIRFTVDGKAEAYKGKVKLESNGKELLITFPKGVESRSQELNERDERSLLSKVLGNSEKKEEPAVEAVPQKEARSKTRLGAVSKPVELAGKTHGPSVFRSLLAMFLIVGGLGMVLLYVKKKAGSAQAKRVGDSWFSGILSGNKKSKAFIEVVANHAIGPKQSITIVRIKEQQFVLGVTQDSVQLITQLDSEEADMELLEDPKVADSIGKMFGSKIKQEPKINPAATFDSILKSSSGAGAIVARNAYQSQSPSSGNPGMMAPITSAAGSGVRDQIRKRLQQSSGGA
jgi:flagellar biogenesis protein FliO